MNEIKITRTVLIADGTTNSDGEAIVLDDRCTIPATLPVTLCFDLSNTVGQARLWRENDKIIADISLQQGIAEKLLKSLTPAVNFFIRRSYKDGGVIKITDLELLSVGIGLGPNADERIKSFGEQEGQDLRISDIVPMSNQQSLDAEWQQLKEAATPLLKLINEKYHPHVSVIVTPTSIELVEGVLSIPKIMDFVKD